MLSERGLGSERSRNLRDVHVKVGKNPVAITQYCDYSGVAYFLFNF